MDAHQLNLMKLIRKDDLVVHTVRASTLASYYWCAVRSYFQALGIEGPKNKYATEGTRLHGVIHDARRNSIYEKEFFEAIKPFTEGLDDKGELALSRLWHNKITVENDHDGWITGHFDEIRVNDDHTLELVEYKTKRTRTVGWVGLGPAVFQVKIYAWILEPIVTLLGYRLKKGHIIFIHQRSQEPIGEYEIDFNFTEIEQEIGDVLARFNDPEAPANLIPCKKWKCLHCPKVFKEKCPFAQKKQES